MSPVLLLLAAFHFPAASAEKPFWYRVDERAAFSNADGIPALVDLRTGARDVEGNGWLFSAPVPGLGLVLYDSLGTVYDVDTSGDRPRLHALYHRSPYAFPVGHTGDSLVLADECEFIILDPEGAVTHVPVPEGWVAAGTDQVRGTRVLLTNRVTATPGHLGPCRPGHPHVNLAVFDLRERTLMRLGRVQTSWLPSMTNIEACRTSLDARWISAEEARFRLKDSRIGGQPAAIEEWNEAVSLPVGDW